MSPPEPVHPCRAFFFEVARELVPVLKPEGLGSWLDHVSTRKRLKQCAHSDTA